MLVIAPFIDGAALMFLPTFVFFFLSSVIAFFNSLDGGLFFHRSSSEEAKHPPHPHTYTYAHTHTHTFL